MTAEPKIPTHAYVRRRACGHVGELVVEMRGTRAPAAYHGGTIERVTLDEARKLGGEMCFGRCPSKEPSHG